MLVSELKMFDFWFLLLLCLSAVLLTVNVDAAMMAKGLYCVDPDTGKLHMVNTTWRSTTFCGNYSCKLRQRNSTEMEYAPSMTVINITRSNTPNKQMNYEIHDDGTERNQTVILSKKTEANIKPSSHKQNNPNVNNLVEEDRYLTEEEIKTISEILHTVRKSDLDAIVEVYNLAQDLYKEMDKKSSNNAADETIKDVDSQDIKTVENNHMKYWYEPLHYNNYRNKPPMEMIKEGTNQAPRTTAMPRYDYFNRNSYFTGGALTGRDFGKLPYYPLSSFQRESSYRNYKPPYNLPPPVAVPYTSSKYPPLAAQNVMPLPAPWFGYDRKPSKMETPKMIQAPLLLPFPLNYPRTFNVTPYPYGFYYNENPRTNYEIQLRNGNYPKTYFGSAYLNPIPSVNVAEKQVPQQNVQNDEIKTIKDKQYKEKNLFEALVSATKDKEDKILPDWQTAPLSTNVLDEVRAHFAEKTKWLKAFPLRKKIKLERVGKVINLEELKRYKRNPRINAGEEKSQNVERYEIYLESVKCQYETEPGFFKHGNLSHPYPSCCPKRLEKVTHH